MATLFALLLAWLFISPITSYSIAVNNLDIVVSPSNISSLESRAGSGGAADFRWIKRWAAIGDSFTAGIGAGNIYSGSKGDRKCSRYDRSYAALLEREFGPSVHDFQYLACSGARTEDIYTQALTLKGNLDLVVLTAGGNDLCLSDIILTCIFLPYQGENKCQQVLDKAEENINTILKGNVRQILDVLNSKMSKEGMVVVNLYSQFFDVSNEDCAKKQDWSFPSLFMGEGLKLTVERRKKFNTLVENINKAIWEVVEGVRRDKWIRYRITYADWDPWPRQAVKGQFCVPGTSGKYPDPKQPELHFFRPNVEKGQSARELKRSEFTFRRAINQTEFDEEFDVYNSLLYKSVNPSAAVLEDLEPRAPLVPSAPKCPGDSRKSGTFGFGLPDRWGKFFHPNELGHRTMAAFALEAIIAERSDILGIQQPICNKPDEFKCWNEKDTGNRYVTADTMDRSYKKYCKDVKPPPHHEADWTDERVFHEGTPDAHKFRISLKNGASEFSEQECLRSFERIVHGCTPKPDNPMNWKFGGRYVRGSYTYEITTAGNERPWPIIQKPDGKCSGSYKFWFSRYTLYGVGWSSWDHGHDTIEPSMKGCLGLGLTNYKFKYYDKPTDDGWEWKLTVNTPTLVKRCFRHDRVQKKSGGFTHGCKGSDP